MDTREALRREIEDTRTAFHQLLDRVPDDAFDRRSTTPEWTIGEVLYHMSLAPRFLTMDVPMILRQGSFYRVLISLIPKRLFDWLMVTFTRWGARRLSRRFLADEYNKAHNRTLAALDAVSDSDFKKSLRYPAFDIQLSGEVDLEALFHYVTTHFQWHAAQVEGALEDGGIND